jgi:hypothetical protein
MVPPFARRCSLHPYSYLSGDTLTHILHSWVNLKKRSYSPKFLPDRKMSLIGRANTALNLNPVTGVDEALSVHGSDWLWAITAIYVLSFVGIPLLSVP